MYKIKMLDLYSNNLVSRLVLYHSNAWFQIMINDPFVWKCTVQNEKSVFVDFIVIELIEMIKNKICA